MARTVVIGLGGRYRCGESERARGCLDIGRFVWQGRVAERGQVDCGGKSWNVE